MEVEEKFKGLRGMGGVGEGPEFHSHPMNVTQVSLKGLKTATNHRFHFKVRKDSGDGRGIAPLSPPVVPWKLQLKLPC